jgi:hypothetical protein
MLVVVREGGGGHAHGRLPWPCPPLRRVLLQPISRTVAEVAFMDPDYFLQSDLYHCVVTDMIQADLSQLKGGDAFRASVEVKDRQWVQLLEAGAPSSRPVVKPGFVPP